MEPKTKIDAIKVPLRIIGDEAGTANFPKEFKTPERRETSEIKIKQKIVIREKEIKNSDFSASEKNPGNKIFMQKGMKICIKIVKINKTKNNIEKIFRTKNTSSLELFLSFNFSTKIGTKAELKAPSAKTRRKKFGKRKAAKKASDTTLTPTYLAIITSRMKPKIREIEI